MTALGFDPWGSLKKQTARFPIAKAANPANSESPERPAQGGLAGISSRLAPASLLEGAENLEISGISRISSECPANMNFEDAVALPPASPEQADDEAAERTLAPKPGWPDPGTPERVRLDERHSASLAGYQRAALMRPPSWPGADRAPSPGAWCSCCGGKAWWREAEGASGWCCTICHPPMHLPAGAVVVVVVGT
jgi:hypothetical protein